MEDFMQEHYLKDAHIHESAFIAWNAHVSGDAELVEHTSVWFSATVRADMAPIKIGKNSNIQDNAVVHVDENIPCIIGENVTVGHGAILHSCTIENGCTVGMGAIILNGAHIGENSMVRDLRPEEIEAMKKNSENYVIHARKEKERAEDMR